MTGTRGGWLDSPSGPLSCWLTGSGDLGIVLLPPLGYEHSASWRTLRAVAEAAAERGAQVLRVEYAGTGDSAGASSSLALAQLREAVPAAAQALRALGSTRIAVAGLRAGALVALLEAASVGAETVVAWAPVLVGKRYPRELRLLGDTPPVEAGLGEKAVVVGGYALPERLLDDLAALTPADLAPAQPAARIVVVDRDDRPASSALLEALPGAEHHVLGGHADFLDSPAEDTRVPAALVAELAALLVPDPAPALPGGGELPASAEVSPGVTEEHARLGSRGLAATRTTGTTPARATLLLLNSGSDPHTGPGRAWVELARFLAPQGFTTVRLDFTGWGESPADPRATGRPYDLHTTEDVLDAAAALETPVVAAGLCAGAWIALHAARTQGPDGPLAGVIALNPQLYWAPGDPVEALMSDTRARRAGEIAAIKQAAAGGRWDAEDEAGSLPDEARWLQELTDAGLPTDLLFAEGDDGLQHLRDRIGRRVAALEAENQLRIKEIPAVDHGMMRVWLRPSVFAAFADALRRAGRPGGSRA